MLLFDELICVEYGKSVFMRFMYARSSYTTARAGLHGGRKKKSFGFILVPFHYHYYEF